jgi:hypothetical protein
MILFPSIRCHLVYQEVVLQDLWEKMELEKARLTSLDGD